MHTTDHEDDLTVIKGIGPSRQRWLRESLNVRTFQELASLSVDEVVSQLRTEGRTASSNEVEAWIEQAQKLAAPAEQPLNKVQANSPREGGDWQPFASFVVEFQSRTFEGQPEERRTTAHHMETDTDASWPDIKSLQLCRWMLEQMGEEPRPELQQQLEDERTKALEELEEKRRQAEQELEKVLEEMRVQARQRLEQQLEDERAQAREQLEQEQTETREALAQAQQELEQQLEQERVRARQELQQELEEMRTQARRRLEEQLEVERAQALEELEQELEEQRRQAEEELEQELERERLQVRQELQQELEKMWTQEQQEMEPPLEESIEEQPPPAEEPEEERVQPRREPEEEPTIEVPPAEATPIGEMPVSITITQVRAMQPPDAEQPTVVGETGQGFYGFLRGGAPFVFEARFELAEGAVAEMLREGMTYNAQFYVRDLSTGTKLHLGNTQPETFIVGESSYTATLPGITLPSGIYRLSVLVTIQNRHPSADYYVMPMLQVA